MHINIYLAVLAYIRDWASLGFTNVFASKILVKPKLAQVVITFYSICLMESERRTRGLPVVRSAYHTLQIRSYKT